MNNQFFNESREQSQIKTAIVAKYFDAWWKILVPRVSKNHGKVGYLDLFAGPGRFDDGTISTPLMILQKAIEQPALADALVTMFNDSSAEHSSRLKQAIAGIENIGRLRYAPTVTCDEVGDQFVKNFEGMKLIPTLFFVDPFGYKGLSLRLVNSVLKDWGCDCIFFFNYNRISMGITNDKVEEHMNGLFGEAAANKLRESLTGLAPSERELMIVEELALALNPTGNRYVLPFRFLQSDGSRTSHHLIFVSKNVTAYSIMKGVMYKESSSYEQGVASFEYNKPFRDQGLLFELNLPLEDLQESLCVEFGGVTLTAKQLIDSHHVGKRFIDKNYKDALKSLEASGRIKTNPSVSDRRKNSFADSVRITFPKK